MEQEVSWLFYWAEVLNNLYWLFQLMIGVAIIFGIALAISCAFLIGHQNKLYWQNWRIACAWWVPFFLLSVSLNAFVPRPEFLYVAAAAKLDSAEVINPTIRFGLRKWTTCRLNPPPLLEEDN